MGHTLKGLLLACLCTSVFGLLLTLMVRSLARVINAIAAPRQDRWHRQPVASFGGIAIYISVILGFFIFAPNAPKAYPILVASTLLFIMGFVDDLVQIKPQTKLIVQLLAAALVVYCNLQLPWTSSKMVNSLITIFWLVGITNALNLCLTTWMGLRAAWL